MKALHITRRSSKALDRIATAITPIVLLVVRLTLAVAFIQAGLGKWNHLDATTAFFESLGLPLPGAHAVVIAALEVVGGAAIVLGTGARTAAGLLSGTMAVALATADRVALVSVIRGEEAPTSVAPLVLLVLLLVVVSSGAGRFSLEQWLSRRLGIAECDS